LKIRLISDIHLEMGSFEVERLQDDENSVLVLAGDIGYLEKLETYSNFIKDLCQRFRHVIYVYGNHEFYKGFWPYSEEKANETFAGLKNLSWGKEFTVVLNDVAFACSTLWSGFEGASPTSMWNCQTTMNDYRLIRTGPKGYKWKRKLSPDDTLAFFRCTTKMFLPGEIKRNKERGNKIVVVTHHAPSLKSISDRFKTDKLNGAYASRLDEMIEKLKPDLWLHGHTHDSFDYEIGETKVVCNPAGYPHERNPQFNNQLLLEV